MADASDRRNWEFADEHVRWAAKIADETGIVPAIQRWQAEARRGPGGAPQRWVSLRGVVVAMVLAARNGRPMLGVTLREILFNNISSAARAELGIAEPSPTTTDMALDRVVRKRLGDMFAVIDPSPFPKNRRLTPDGFAAATRPLSDAEIQLRTRRLTWVINQVLDVSARQLPETVLARWDGSLAVDATAIRLFSRAERRARGQGKAKGRALEVHSADPDGAWYIRNDDHRDPETLPEGAGEDDEKPSIRKKATRVIKGFWGMELTLVIMGAGDPMADRTFPYLVIGMAPAHKPGHAVGANALVAIRSVHGRGYPAGWVVGDLAYPNSVPDEFQLPVRAMGYKLGFDYKIDQLGSQGSYAGALLVDGTWMCPCTDEVLINATRDMRLGLGRARDQQSRLDCVNVWRERIDERRALALRPKGQPDSDGYVRFECPAAGSSPTVLCALKPRSLRNKSVGNKRVFLVEEIEARPPQICRQQSVTFPPTAGAKFRQDVPHASEEWTRRYSSLRNTIEGVHGFVKDGAFEALDDPECRRIRGMAAQSVFAAWALFGANMRKIDGFERDSVDGGDGVQRLRVKARRRRDASLDRYRLPDMGLD